MDYRRPRLGAFIHALLLVAVCSAPPAHAAAEAGAAAPQRFLEGRTDPALRHCGPGAVRVRIGITTDPVIQAAATPEMRGQLGGSVHAGVQRGLRGGTVSGTTIARRYERGRSAAIRRLQIPAARAAASQRSLVAAVRARGGRPVEADPVTNTVTADMPCSAIPGLVMRNGVRAIERVRTYPRVATGLALSTAAVGAPTFWASGYTGGSGASDGNPVDVAIVRDQIQQDHPAFAGLDFQNHPRATSSTDHGTAVASMAVSRGAVGCAECVAEDATHQGVAPGVDSVLDANPNGNAYVWALGITAPVFSGEGEVTGASDPAEVLNDSGGAQALEDDNMALQSVDTYASAFGATITLPAGNDGPSRTVAEPCIAYNSLCLGAFRHMGTDDPSDDVIADFSSRGPSPAGRKKPDLVAVGVTSYAARLWSESSVPLWRGSMQGTSFAAPQGAGAAALLAGSGITDPSLQKAVLINSSRLGRATSSDPMGTQTTWQPDWGWGALNLEGALAERTNGVSGSVPGSSARFFRASSVTAADRATLVWNRRAAADCYTGRCAPEAMTLTNLDLQQLDASTGAILAQSNSAIDNVEQVRSPAPAATAIYKVKATSSVDGLAAEPFAVTARRPLTPLATPQPTVTIDVADAAQRPGQTSTVTATVRNPSADLTAENASVTLEPPAGVEIVAGAETRNLGTLATSSSTHTLTWTVKGTADGLKQIAARAQASRYGETFTSTAADDYVVDGTPPIPTIAAPAGTTTQRSLAVAWGATDAQSPITTFDVEISTDQGPWTSWLSGTQQREATLTGAAGHTYRFRARATDALSNVSGWVESASISVADAPSPTPQPPPSPTPPSATLTNPSLTLATVKRTRTGLSMSGKIARRATGRVSLAYSTKTGRKTYKAKPVTARIKRGRFTATIKLPAAARKQKRGTLVLRYAGDASFAARTLKRTVTAR